MKSGKLNGAVFYLSGPMEYAEDLGVGWRVRLQSLLQRHNIGIKCIDPTNKPKGLDGIDTVTEDVGHGRKLKKEGRWDELTKYVKAYRRFDLRFCDLADALIIKVDNKIHMCGSYDELFVCERQKKPIFAIVTGGLETLPAWCFAAIPWRNVFVSEEDLVKHLIKIDSGEIVMDDRWVLIRDSLKSLNDE